MKRLKRYMSGITLKKQYIFKFILVMLLPLVTAEAVFYTLHVRSVEKDAVKLIEYRLAQSQQLVDARVKELMEIAVRVRADSRLRIDSLENDIHLRIQATTLLSAHNATNKLCQNIQIYYQPMDGVYSHEGFTGTEAFLKRRCRLSDEDAASLLDVLRHCVYNRVERVSIEGTDCLVFLFPIQKSSLQSFSTLFFYVPCGDLQAQLGELMHMDGGSRVALLDEKGRAIFSEIRGEGAFARDGYPLEQGNERCKLDSADELVFYRDSSVNGWRYLCAVPTEMLTSGDQQQQLLLLQIGLMLVVLGLGIALMSAWSSYRPIGRLSDSMGVEPGQNELDGILTSVIATRENYRQLQQLMDQNTPMMADSAMEQFLSRHIDGETCSRKLREIGIDLSLPGFAVASVGMLAGEESASTSTAHQSILQIAQEMCVESEGELNVLPLERGYENVILLVFNLAAEADAGEQVGILAQKLAAAGLSELTAVGVGREYDDFGGIAASYTEAMIAMESLRFRKRGGVRSYDDTLGEDTSGVADDMKEKRLRLLQYIRQGNEALALETLEEIHAELSAEGRSYLFTRYELMNIAIAIVQEARELSGKTFEKEIESVLHMRDIRQSLQDLARLTALLCRHVNHMRSESDKRLGADMIAYANANFARPDISLETMAQHFSLSSYYVSRYFGRCAGVPFREYITRLRIDYAKKLLLDTDEPVREIVERVGYLDASTFGKRFKQVEGVTPTEFRARKTQGKEG